MKNQNQIVSGGLRKLSFGILVVVVLLTVPVSIAQDNPLLNGIYTEDQAARGLQFYTENCASCHANDLRGNSNSPGLIGLSFLFLWEGRTLEELFGKMRDEMPTDRPGALPLNTYLDLTAFLLKSNEYPAADEELTLDIIDAGVTIVSPH